MKKSLFHYSANFFSTVGLSFLWEFALKGLILGVDPGPFELRLNFVFTSSTFVFLALLLPTWLGLRYLKKYQQAQSNLSNTSMKLEMRQLDSNQLREIESIALAEREKLFHLLDHLPMAFHLQASDYSVPYANKVFREWFAPPEKRMCYDLMHQRSKPCDVCTTFKVFETKENVSSVWNALDGRTYLTLCTPLIPISTGPSW